MSADLSCPKPTVALTTPEIVGPDDTLTLYEEALQESTSTTRDEAKAVIAAQIRELTNLRNLVTKAEQNLAKLLKKPVSEIAMMRRF